MTRRRVLLCEDEGLTTLRIRRSLTRLGYDVVSAAHNGEEAVQLAAQLEPDIILMDINMPKLNGIEATREIMKRRPTVIVMLTAYSDQPLVEAALEAGASGYLVKPISDDQLEPALAAAQNRFLERSAGGDGGKNSVHRE